MSRKDKSIDLAGRLGSPYRTGLGGAGKTTNYGVDRLGLASGSEPEPAEQTQPSESYQSEQDFEPEGEHAGQRGSKEEFEEAASPAAEDGDGRYDQSGESVEAIPPGAREQRRKALLGAGALGLMLTLGVIALGWWCCCGDKPVPQVASASPEASEEPTSTAPAEPSRAGETEVGAGRTGRIIIRTAGPSADGEPGPAPVAASAEPPQPRPTAPTDAPPLPAWAAPQRPAPPALAAARSGKPLLAAAKLLLTPWRRMFKPPPAPATGSSRTAGPVTPPAEEATPAFEVNPNGIALSGILRGPNGAIAVINNRPVTEGEVVRGAKVVRIGSSFVEFERNGRRFLVGVSSSLSTGQPPPREPEAQEEDAPPAGQSEKAGN